MQKYRDVVISSQEKSGWKGVWKMEYELIYPLFLYAAMNVIGYAVMYVDKKRAIRHEYRISEKTLWGIAMFGGAVGSTLGMRKFRHKTKHLSFKIGFPFLAVVQICLFLLLIAYFLTGP